MRQVTQRPRDGRIEVKEVPAPTAGPGWALVENRFSLISAGTERTKVDFGRASLVGKARARPDLVRKVVDRARTEGVRSAVELSRERLSEPTPLGYSSAGVVRSLGVGVEGFAPGDRVACAGAGWANHAELVAVPRNLLARVPENVSLEEAAYATLGAIALHAVRQADARVGEFVGVVGLGLVGQLVVRLLSASGCHAVGIDVDGTAVGLAATAGATRAFLRADPSLEPAVLEASRGIGLDAVIVCAAAGDADPIDLASRLARDRGRIVIVGDLPISADRRLFYEKELELRLSRSYGPGRYDRDYEERGRDLPAGYVRWTEQRNLQAFVDLIASGAIRPSELTTHRFPIDRAGEAFALLEGKGANRPFGVLLEYPEGAAAAREPAPVRPARAAGRGTVGLVGAGSFARSTLIPALKGAGAELAVVTSARGLSAADAVSRAGFERVASSVEEILDDPGVDALVVATRHSDHASLAAAALAAGKSVFVEKPLAVTPEQLAEVEQALRAGGRLMVGFNRRFAPLTVRLREAIGPMSDLVVTCRVNAGPLPADHWLHDPEEGGGRPVGEGCHFVDLLSHLAGAPALSVSAVAVPQAGREIGASDSFTASFRFANGAVGSLVYSGGGATGFPKERIEVFGGGLSAVLDDFRRLDLYRGRHTTHRLAQDKGHRAELACFVRSLRGEAELPPVETYLASSRATLALADSLRTGETIALA
jgi:predicted dehydrogenase/threonine dehydrogenase-like Zn-dependent dehydrogenase